MSKILNTDLILNKDGSVYHLSLKPGQISDTIITVGDPGRVHNVSQHFDDVEFEMNKREFITHVGQYKGKRITVISTGMGTDNVEIFFNEIDALFNVNLKTREEKQKKKKLRIVRVGTSGALQEDLPLDAHLVSDYAVGLDTLMFFYKHNQDAFEKQITQGLKDATGIPFVPYMARGSQELLKKVGEGMVVGNTITCPGFYAPQGRQLRTKLQYPNLIEDLYSFHYKNFWLTNFEMETAGYYAMANLLGHDMLSVNAIIANRITDKFSSNPNKTIDSLIVKVLDRL